MRRKDREITDESDMINLLQSQLVGTLSLITTEGPYCVPVNYLYLDECIYFHCALEGRKIESIQYDNRVCFLVEQIGPLALWDKRCGITQIYKSVISFGTAEIITDFNIKKNILIKMTDKYISQEYNYSSMKDEYIHITNIVKINIGYMTGKENKLSQVHTVIN
jgi:uncharacterized protein